MKKLAELMDGPILCTFGGKGKGGRRWNITLSKKQLAPSLPLKHFNGQKFLRRL